MLHAAMVAVASWWCIPRFFRLLDARLGRQRLYRESVSTRTFASASNNTSPLLGEAEIFDSLAMAVRSGVNARDALDALAADCTLPQEFTDVLSLQPSLPLQQTLIALQQIAINSQWSLVASLLLQSYRHGSLDPSALDIAAQTIRDNNRRKDRLLAATAQARITIRILTSLPLATLALGFLMSSVLRASLQHVAVVLLLLLGLLLNCGGFLWMKFIAGSVNATSRPNALQELLTSTAISINSGDSLAEAIERWHGVNSVGRRVVERVRNGEILAQALAQLEHDCGSMGQTVKRLLIDSHLSGGSVAEVVARLKNDVEAESSRRTEVLLQQISTKLALPLVVCILPAFLLLALMPIAMASIGSLPSPSAL